MSYLPFLRLDETEPQDAQQPAQGSFHALEPRKLSSQCTTPLPVRIAQDVRMIAQISGLRCLAGHTIAHSYPMSITRGDESRNLYAMRKFGTGTPSGTWSWCSRMPEAHSTRRKPGWGGPDDWIIADARTAAEALQQMRVALPGTVASRGGGRFRPTHPTGPWRPSSPPCQTPR
jgi:hypothetical protein